MKNELYGEEMPVKDAGLVVESIDMEFGDRQNNKVQVIKSLSFKAKGGEFVSILGPSGCGKSTLLKIIAGLVAPLGGNVFLDGKRVTRPGKDRGMVFQAYTAFDWLTIERNIEFGLVIGGLQPQERKSLVDRYLISFGLYEFRNNYPNSLSGGMKQRLAIARTLVNKPRVLLMDEPFGALDLETRWQMRKFLLDRWQAESCIIVFVTHDLEEALFLSDRILVSGKRPASIIADITVPFVRPRELELRYSNDFLAKRREIEKIFHWQGESCSAC